MLTRNNPLSCDNAHVSLIAHITPEEIRELLHRTDANNGFANRFLWIWSERSKLLPHGSGMQESDLNALLEPVASRLRDVAEFANNQNALSFDGAARTRWEEVYERLADGHSGIVGSLAARNRAHALRLALAFAVLDCSPVIPQPHLEAALAIVDYSVQSIQHVFAGGERGGLVGKLLAALQSVRARGATKTEISGF